MRAPRFGIVAFLFPWLAGYVDEAAAQVAASDCPSVVPAVRARAPARCGFRCGTDRWPVKTLTDRDAHSVDVTPRAATVSELGRLRRPSRHPNDRRVGAAERRVYCVEAWYVDLAGPQADGDLHVVIAGVEDTTTRMIVEFPDVRCVAVCASPYAAAIADARQAMERKLANWKADTLRLRIVGVGFFDRNHGQSGAAPNWFELHPVLAVSFP